MFASLRGAGLFAAISLGMISLDDVRGLVRVTNVFEPDRKIRVVYEPMYSEFKRFYGSLHASYARLNRTSEGS
jgi:xylulokinase